MVATTDRLAEVRAEIRGALDALDHWQRETGLAGIDEDEISEIVDEWVNSGIPWGADSDSDEDTLYEWVSATGPMNADLAVRLRAAGLVPSQASIEITGSTHLRRGWRRETMSVAVAVNEGLMTPSEAKELVSALECLLTVGRMTMVRPTGQYVNKWPMKP